jgi:type VI protein secretion system component VasF
MFARRVIINATLRWQQLTDPRSRDRGDVPGWVLVAVMTAGLVTALWLVADGQLTSVLNRAITSVTKP